MQFSGSIEVFYKFFSHLLLKHLEFCCLQGFRKIDPDKWEFSNEAFLRGQKHLLRNIRRRKAPSLSPSSSTSLTSSQAPPSQHQAIGPCLELGRFGLDTEIDSLRRDKHVLMMELVKLRQQQQNTRAYLKQMELRIQGTERRQQQMMSFLARAMQNPDFIHQLVQQKEKRKELEDAMSKKRRRPIEAGDSVWRSSNNASNSIKIEPLEFNGFEVSELEALALEMQGFGRARRETEEDAEDTEELKQLGSYDKELDEGFWQELLNEGFVKEVEMPKDDQENGEEQNVDVLADRLGFLGSSPK